MNMKAGHLETEQIVADDLDRVAIFSALGLNEDQQEKLTQAWQECAPNVPLQDYARTVVLAGSQLAMDLETGQR